MDIMIIGMLVLLLALDTDSKTYFTNTYYFRRGIDSFHQFLFFIVKNYKIDGQCLTKKSVLLY